MQRAFAIGILVLSMMLGLAGASRAQSLVYVGGGDEHTGAYDGYLADPAGWAWVREHADGYYINTFPLKNDPDDATQNANLSGMSALFKHKNVFYETELQNGGHNVSDADDVARMAILEANGFTVTLTTCNMGVDQARMNALRTGNPNRPVYAMQGPWAVGGDINASNTNATNWRDWIALSDGSSTDSPLAIWEVNENMCREASYSAVKYAHMLGKRAMIMMCPHRLMTDANWLKQGKLYIQNHEDNDAIPDIWAISYYAAYLEAHSVTPEQVDGAPADSVTGLAYYLIHHLRDPDRVARWQVPSASGVVVGTGTATIDAVGDANAAVKLVNSSSWLDLIPVIRASAGDPAQAWTVSYTLDGVDVTSALSSPAGLTLYKTRRLAANSNQEIVVSRKLRSGKSPSAPLAITLSLSAHPSEPAVLATQQLHFRDPAAADEDAGVNHGDDGGGASGQDAGGLANPVNDAGIRQPMAGNAGSAVEAGTTGSYQPATTRGACACTVALGATSPESDHAAWLLALMTLAAWVYRRNIA